ncbi:MAG: hypothetical protein E6R08_00865 [Nevskiaceae bacterium]|nr:MAG: hypothetical protein E6R08_00865 [Nevskiaceae bacterium]
MRCFLSTRSVAAELRALGLSIVLMAASQTAWAEKRFEVEARRTVGRNETADVVRRDLERDLRRQALSRIPTIVEWDRQLSGERFDEVTRELTGAAVKLEAARESLAQTEGGDLVMTVRAVAVVDDHALQDWAARLGEVEALRNELTTTRRRAESKAVVKGTAPDIEAVSSVSLRTNDAADLAALAAARSASRSRDVRTELLDLLRGTSLSVGGIQATKTPGSSRTGFAIDLAWNMHGLQDLKRFLGADFEFKKPTEGSIVEYFSVQATQAVGEPWLREAVLGSRVYLELQLGQASQLVPIAYPARWVAMKGAASCVDDYGNEWVEPRANAVGMGWCVLKAGSSDLDGAAGTPNVKAKATVWVQDERLPTANGPYATWVVKWKDGRLDRLPAVVVKKRTSPG